MLAMGGASGGMSPVPGSPPPVPGSPPSPSPPQIRAQLQAQGVQPREVRLMRNKSSGEPGPPPGTAGWGAPMSLGPLWGGTHEHESFIGGGSTTAPRGAGPICRSTQGCCIRLRGHPKILIPYPGAPRAADPISMSTQSCCTRLRGHPGVLIPSPGAPRGVCSHLRGTQGCCTSLWGAPRGAHSLPRGTQGCWSHL